MARTLSRALRMAGLIAGGKMSPRKLLAGMRKTQVSVTGKDGMGYFCEAPVARMASGCPDDDVRPVWQGQRVGILDGEYRVRALVGKDADGHFHAGLSLEDQTGNEEVNWDVPLYTLNEARKAANAWLTASVPLGVVLYSDQTASVH